MRTIDCTSEIQVRNEFVDAVHADDSGRIADAGQRLVSSCFEGEFNTPDEAESGVMLSAALLPDDPDSDASHAPGVEVLEGLLSPDRLNALMDGDALREDELALWRQTAAEDILASTDLDWDVYSMWSVWCVTHEDGRHAFLATIGGGFSVTEPWNEYKGSGRTLEDALEALKSEGFISVQDFRERRLTDSRMTSQPPRRL